MNRKLIDATHALPDQALADLLKLTHRGYFIPPRPEKNPVEGQRASQVRGARCVCRPYGVLHCVSLCMP